MTEQNQQFESFTEWLNKASSWLTRHEDYSKDFRVICWDSKARICRIGADFMRARDEDAFPVYWLWPDQVVEVAMMHQAQEALKNSPAAE